MNYWMTEERREIARRYVHNMINSFVDDPHTGNYHDENNLPYVQFFSPDIERFLAKVCYDDKYTLKHPQFEVLHDVDNIAYDIDGHRVFVINSTINIAIDGVAYDQLEVDQWMSYTTSNKKNETSRFQVRLSPK